MYIRRSSQRHLFHIRTQVTTTTSLQPSGKFMYSLVIINMQHVRDNTVIESIEIVGCRLHPRRFDSGSQPSCLQG